MPSELDRRYDKMLAELTGPLRPKALLHPKRAERWLRPLAEGRALGAFGLTEPDAGSDARGIKTRAER